MSKELQKGTVRNSAEFKKIRCCVSQFCVLRSFFAESPIPDLLSVIQFYLLLDWKFKHKLKINSRWSTLLPRWSGHVSRHARATQMTSVGRNDVLLDDLFWWQHNIDVIWAENKIMKDVSRTDGENGQLKTVSLILWHGRDDRLFEDCWWGHTQEWFPNSPLCDSGQRELKFETGDNLILNDMERQARKADLWDERRRPISTSLGQWWTRIHDPNIVRLIMTDLILSTKKKELRDFGRTTNCSGWTTCRASSGMKTWRKTCSRKGHAWRLNSTLHVASTNDQTWRKQHIWMYWNLNYVSDDGRESGRICIWRSVKD